MKKRQRKKKKLSWWRRYRNYLVLAGVLVLLGIGSIILFKPFPKPHEVEAKPDIKVLPKEIKKKLHVASPSASFRIPVLMYHYVEYVKDKRDTIRQSLDTTPSIFEKELQTLQNAHYTFLTMKDMADIMDGNLDLPDKPVVLTFDDGYRDFYTDVYPLLKKYHIKATAYIISGFLGGPNYMDPWMVQQIAKDGLVEIGAHTVHHIDLKRAPLKTATIEIVDSKTTLEALIHQPVVSFAYPYGSFNTQAIDIVKQAGFRTAVSTIPGNITTQETRFFIFRIRSGGRVGENLLSFLEKSVYKPY